MLLIAYLCFRCFSVCADHSVAPVHLQSSQWHGRNALLPEWHRLPISVLVQTAERNRLSVNGVYCSWHCELWRRIQIWVSGRKVDGEAVVSDSTRRSEERWGCLSVCCLSTQCCDRHQVCDKNMQHGDYLLIWHLTHINNQMKELNLTVEKMMSVTLTACRLWTALENENSPYLSVVSTLKTSHVCVFLTSDHLQSCKLLSRTDSTNRWRHSTWYKAFIMRMWCWIHRHRHKRPSLINLSLIFLRAILFLHISPEKCLQLCTHLVFSSSGFHVRAKTSSWISPHETIQ